MTVLHPFAVPVCIASVDAATGERRVKQLLASAVTLSTGGGGGGGDATIDEDVAAMKVASLQRKTHSGSGTEYIEAANFHNADSGTVPIAVYAKNERNESIKTVVIRSLL